MNGQVDLFVSVAIVCFLSATFIFLNCTFVFHGFPEDLTTLL